MPAESWPAAWRGTRPENRLKPGGAVATQLKSGVPQSATQLKPGRPQSVAQSERNEGHGGPFRLKQGGAVATQLKPGRP